MHITNILTKNIKTIWKNIVCPHIFLLKQKKPTTWINKTGSNDELFQSMLSKIYYIQKKNPSTPSAIVWFLNQTPFPISFWLGKQHIPETKEKEQADHLLKAKTIEKNEESETRKKNVEIRNKWSVWVKRKNKLTRQQILKKLIKQRNRQTKHWQQSHRIRKRSTNIVIVQTCNMAKTCNLSRITTWI